MSKLIETFEQTRKRANLILKRLKKWKPDAKIALKYSSNIQLLAAVILSAQCTDKKVNEVTGLLFKKYKTVGDFADADLKTFEQEIKSTGFYRAKAKNIITAAKMIREKFGGKLPRTIVQMTELPGVGRKTANIVLGNAYGIVEGIAVDTHVRRVSRHLGLTNHNDPEKIEEDLMKLFDKKDWFQLAYLFIEYGRNIHTAKKPILCSHGPLKGLCPNDG
jgi:endonuclease-3